MTKGTILGLADNEAERYVIAAMMQPAYRGYVIEHVTADLFTDHKRRIVAQAVLNLRNRSDPITIPHVLAESRAAAVALRLSTDSINENMLIAMQEFDIGLRAVEVDLRTLMRLARMRTWEGPMEEFIRDVSTRQPEAVIRTRLFDLLTTVLSGGEEDDSILLGSDLPEFVDTVLKEIMDARRIRYPWPWKGAFGRIAKPLMPSLMGIIGMPDGHGKSTMAMMVAMKWASIGHRVAFFHTEYDRSYMVLRIIASLAGVPIDLIEQNKVTKEQGKRIEQAKQFWRDHYTNLHLVEASDMSPRDVATKIGELNNAGLLTAVIVDYLQDLDFSYWQRQGAYVALGEGTKVIHKAIGRARAAGIVVAQGNKSMLDVDVADLNRRQLDLPAAALRKSQITILAKRQQIKFPGQETIYRDGEPVAYGEPGQLSPILEWRVDKQTNGPSGIGALLFTENFMVMDLDRKDPRYDGNFAALTPAITNNVIGKSLDDDDTWTGEEASFDDDE